MKTGAGHADAAPLLASTQPLDVRVTRGRREWAQQRTRRVRALHATHRGMLRPEDREGGGEEAVAAGGAGEAMAQEPVALAKGSAGPAVSLSTPVTVMPQVCAAAAPMMHMRCCRAVAVWACISLSLSLAHTHAHS
jgi:hypothetical protein